MTPDRRCARCRTPFTPRSGGPGRRQLYCGDVCRVLAARARRQQPAYFSSATPEWSTPQVLFDRLDERWHFTLDRLADGQLLVEGDPIYALRRQLRTIATDRARVPSQQLLAALCIKAWNFYRAGRTDIGLITWKRGGAKPEPFPTPR